VILCDGDGDEKMLILRETGTDGDGNSFCGDGWGWVQGSTGTVGGDLNFTGRMEMRINVLPCAGL